MADTTTTTATTPLLTDHKPTTPPPSIDDMIETYIGGTGAGQLFQAFFVALAWAFDAQQVFISVFTDAEPRWHCTSPACSPAAETPCSLPPGAWAWDRPAEASVVSEWALECAGPALVSLPASSFFAGCLAGGFLLATLADSVLGRKKMLLASCLAMSLAGLLTAAAPNVWAYAALRFVSGFGRSMIGTCTLVLSTEVVGKRWRDAASVAGFFCYTLGFLSLPALAYTFRASSWRAMYLWTSLPSLCYTLLLYFLIQESPRWLLVRGRKQEAVDTLRRLAALDCCGGGITSSFSMLYACTVQEAAGGVFAALSALWERKWAMRRLAATMTASFGVGMLYYGMPLNVGSLGADLYLTVTSNALAELPSAVATFLLIGRINRRGAVLALTAAAGLCSLACLGLRARAARMAAEVASFFATCTAFNIMLIYSMELFPTCVRNSALGLVRQAMVLGGIAAPVLVAMGRRESFWSFGVFGIVVATCGLAAACLPETRGTSMCDTMEEEERKQAAIAATSHAAAANTASTDSLV